MIAGAYSGMQPLNLAGPQPGTKRKQAFCQQSYFVLIFARKCGRVYFRKFIVLSK